MGVEKGVERVSELGLYSCVLIITTPKIAVRRLENRFIVSTQNGREGELPLYGDPALNLKIKRSL